MLLICLCMSAVWYMSLSHVNAFVSYSCVVLCIITLPEGHCSIGYGNVIC